MEEKDGTSPMNKNVEERILHPKSGMAMLFSADPGHCGKYCADDTLRGSDL